MVTDEYTCIAASALAAGVRVAAPASATDLALLKDASDLLAVSGPEPERGVAALDMVIIVPSAPTVTTRGSGAGAEDLATFGLALDVASPTEAPRDSTAHDASVLREEGLAAAVLRIALVATTAPGVRDPAVLLWLYPIVRKGKGFADAAIALLAHAIAALFMLLVEWVRNPPAGDRTHRKSARRPGDSD